MVRERSDADGNFAYTIEQLTALAVDDEIEAPEPERLPDRDNVAY